MLALSLHVLGTHLRISFLGNKYPFCMHIVGMAAASARAGRAYSFR